MDAMALVVEESVVAFAGRKKSLKSKEGYVSEMRSFLTNLACPSRPFLLFSCSFAVRLQYLEPCGLRISASPLSTLELGGHRQLQMKSYVLLNIGTN